jgi:hypothetical protein
MCQLIYNVYGNKNVAGQIAQKLMALMEGLELFSDLAFILCFDKTYFKKNLDWFMQSRDLTKPGFQMHQTAVRYYIMDKTLDSLSKKALKITPGFEDFRRTLKLEDKEGNPIDAEMQQAKCRGFIKDSHALLTWHFRRCVNRDQIGAVLLSEDPCAKAAARVILGRAPDLNADKEYDNQMYYSEVHKEYISICAFEKFLKDKFTVELAREGKTFDDANPYNPEDLFDAMVVTTANNILDPTCDVDYRKLEMCYLAHDQVIDSQWFMWERFLPAASQTQFVEELIKLLAEVSQTGRGKEARTAWAVVNQNVVLPFIPEKKKPGEEPSREDRLSRQSNSVKAYHYLKSADAHGKEAQGAG